MAQITRLGRKRLVDILIEEGVVKEDQLREANLKVRVTGESLIDTLHSLGFVTETEVARSVAKQYGFPFIDPLRYRIPREAADAVPLPFLRLNQIIVLDKIGRTLMVAVSGILSAEVLEKIERTRRGRVRRAKLYYLRTLKGKAARIKEHRIS